MTTSSSVIILAVVVIARDKHSSGFSAAPLNAGAQGFFISAMCRLCHLSSQIDVKLCMTVCDVGRMCVWWRFLCLQTNSFLALLALDAFM